MSKVYIVIRNDSYYSETPIQRRIVGGFSDRQAAKDCLKRIKDEFDDYYRHRDECHQGVIRAAIDWVCYMGLATQTFSVTDAHDQAYAISRIGTILKLASENPVDVDLDEVLRSVEVIQREMKINQDPDYPTEISVSCPEGNPGDYQIVEVDVV